MLAFINIIFIYSLLDGIIERTEMNVIEFRYGQVVIEPIDENPFINNADSLMRNIESLPEVVGVTSHYILGASIYHKEKEVTQSVYSIDPEEERTVTKIENHLVEGSFLSKHDTDYILLGNEVTGGYEAKLEKTSLGGVHAGDKVEVVYSNGLTKEYRVKGIFNTMDIITDLRAFVTQEEMENILGVDNKASEIIIKLDKIGNEEAFIEKLYGIGVKEEIDIWEERAGIAVSMIESFFIIKTLLGFISVLVAGVTIFIVIYITTVNKRKEIGILKAVGIKRNIIIKSFLFQSMFYTLSGSILGYIVLMLFINPYFAIRPLKFPVGWVTLTILTSTIFRGFFSLVGAAFIGGIIPSWKVARDKILKLIWG
ncbi:FtsX-like permease family protein [Candidatus Woesearchaeota archaeon]|nr:FtsX-like permease family protein [Candidatus Woesearchaeota archaeon]